MRGIVRASTLVAGLCAGLSCMAGDAIQARYTLPPPGFIRLFNGHDLSGWRLGNDVLTGKRRSPDGRYEVENGEIVVNAGKGIEVLYTTHQFNRNFRLKLEFRAARRADSGLYIRGRQLQVRDYPTVGPYRVVRFNEGGWNELEIVVNGRKARCTCDEVVVEPAFEIPVAGSIGLQAETGKFEYRRIEIEEAPSG